MFFLFLDNSLTKVLAFLSHKKIIITRFSHFEGFSLLLISKMKNNNNPIVINNSRTHTTIIPCRNEKQNKNLLRPTFILSNYSLKIVTY